MTQHPATTFFPGDVGITGGVAVTFPCGSTVTMRREQFAAIMGAAVLRMEQDGLFKEEDDEAAEVEAIVGALSFFASREV